MNINIMRLPILVLVLISVKTVVSDTNEIPDSTKTNNVESFENCVLNGDLKCIELLVKSKIYKLIAEKELRFGDNIVIETVNETKTVEEPRESNQEGRGFDWVNDVKQYMSHRALKVDLWDLLRLKFSKSLKSPDNVELTLGLNPEAVEMGRKHRSNKMARMIVPLIIGFMLTGKLILSIAFVKALLMKAFLVSNLALGAAAFLVIKKFLTMNQHHPLLFMQPFYNNPLDVNYGQSALGTPYSNYATITPSAQQAWAAHYSGESSYSPAAAGSGEYEAGGGSAEDLQGHYSNTVNATAKIRRKFSHGGLVGLSGRSPVMAYRQVSLGRKV